MKLSMDKELLKELELEGETFGVSEELKQCVEDILQPLHKALVCGSVEGSVPTELIEGLIDIVTLASITSVIDDIAKDLSGPDIVFEEAMDSLDEIKNETKKYVALMIMSNFRDKENTKIMKGSQEDY